MVVTTADISEFFNQLMRFLRQPFPIAGMYFSLLQVWCFTSIFYIAINTVAKAFGQGKVEID